MTKAEKKRAAMLSGPIWPLMVRMAVPGILAMLISLSMSVVETWHLGQLGTVELAAVALVFPIYMLTMMLSAGSVGGVASGFAANAVGAGDQPLAEMILRSGLRIALVAGLGMALLFWLIGPAFYAFLGGEGAVLEAAVSYSNVLMLGLVLMWTFNMVAGIFRGAGDMTTPALLQLLVSASHFILCWIFIVRLKLGIEGAALAMICAFGIGNLGLVLVFITGRAAVPYRRGIVERSILLPMVKLGSLAGFQAVITIATTLLITGLMGQIGVAWLAGYGVGARLEFLMIPVIFGFGAALIAIGGVNRGAGQQARAQAIAWRGTGAATLIVGMIGILSASFPEAWVRFFTSDPEVIAAGATYMQTVAPFYAFFALGLTLYFASQAMQTLTIPVIGTLLRLSAIGGGGLLFWWLELTEPRFMFYAVATGMFAYGTFVALGLRFISWRRVSPPVAA